MITGANSHPDVLSVAGVDVTGMRVGYSSRGPGRAKALRMKNQTSLPIPHFVGSGAYGIGSADGGTSTACPVAAGCIAAIRTRVPPSLTSPANLFEAVRTTAVNPGGQTGWNADVGYGILKTLDAAKMVSPAV